MIVMSSFMLHIILIFNTSLPFFLFFQCCLGAPFLGPQSTLGEAVNGIPRISRIAELSQIPRSWALFTSKQAEQNCQRAGTPNNGLTLYQYHNSPDTEQARRTMVSPCLTNIHTRYCTIVGYVDLRLYRLTYCRVNRLHISSSITILYYCTLGRSAHERISIDLNRSLSFLHTVEKS
jgi:hypothetical protein